MAKVGTTLLDVVNKIMIRLRDQVVTSISSTKNTSPATTSGSPTYTDTVIQLINDAKREVEDTYNWLALQKTITISTADTVKSYAIENTSTAVYSNPRSRVLDVYNTTRNVRLVPRTYNYLRQMIQMASPPSQEPTMYAIQGLQTPTYSSSDSTPTTNQSLQVYLYPIPDAAYSLDIECVVPQEDLTLATDYFTAPWYPIHLRALSLCIRERGEDEGEVSSDIERAYQKALGDAIAYEQDQQHQGQGGGDWVVLGDY